MAKKRTQALRQSKNGDEIFSALKFGGQKAIVARAREYFGPVNELANGDKLNVLRAHMGSMRFGKFMGETLPKLGISRSTGYRWARQALGLSQFFKNPLVRARLMEVGRGRGILTVDGKRLTPSVKKALKQLPPEPRARDNAKAQRWTAQLLAGAAKARVRARSRLSSGR